MVSTVKFEQIKVPLAQDKPSSANFAGGAYPTVC